MADSNAIEQCLIDLCSVCHLLYSMTYQEGIEINERESTSVQIREEPNAYMRCDVPHGYWYKLFLNQSAGKMSQCI